MRRAVASRSAALNGLLSGATRAAWLEDSTAAATAKVDELATLRGLAKVVGAPAEDLARLEDTIVEFETLTVVRFGAAYDAKSESAMRVRAAFLLPRAFPYFFVPSRTTTPFSRAWALARWPCSSSSPATRFSWTSSRCCRARRCPARRARLVPFFFFCSVCLTTGGRPEEVAAFVTAFLDKLAPMMESQHNLIGDVFGADAAPIRLLFVERVFEQTVRMLFVGNASSPTCWKSPPLTKLAPGLGAPRLRAADGQQGQRDVPQDAAVRLHGDQEDA